jgi:hypothetical protein
MFFAIDYNYNTKKWYAELIEYWLYAYPLPDDEDRKVYVGY